MKTNVLALNTHRNDAGEMPGGPDATVYALIALHETAERIFEVSCRTQDQAEGLGKNVQDTAATIRETADEFSGQLLKRLCNTKPTTPAGIAALAEYFGKRYDCNYFDKRTQNIFRTLAAACRDLERPK